MQQDEKDYNELPRLMMKGHVKITDQETGEVLFDGCNDINPENMSFAIAQALSAEEDASGQTLGAIHQMRFGNGGTTIIAGEDRINYKTPRVSTLSSLYSDRYGKNINTSLDISVDKNYNSVQSIHIPGQTFSDIVVTCTLGLGEPEGQSTTDADTIAGIDGSKSDFVFDELGLYDYSGKHLTHIIFHPIQKSQNRILQIKYTIRVQLV